MKKIVLGVMTAMVLVSGAYCKSEIKEIKNTVIETIATTQKTGVKVVTTYSIPFSDFKQMQKNDANGSSTHTSWGLMETGYTKSGMYYEYYNAPFFQD
jgi:hypothetical protein